MGAILVDLERHCLWGARSLNELMLSNLRRALTLIPGWRTRRKLVVVQSDDWFSIRTSSLDALRKLSQMGVKCDRCHYMQFDHFERASDLSGLFETLSSISDSVGRPCVITTNCLSANPDFVRIKESGFTKYFEEPSLLTASEVPGAEANHKHWQQAIRAGICEPQSHGREHLNVRRWLRALQSGTDLITRAAFECGMFGVSGHVVPDRRESFLAALDTTHEAEPANPETYIIEALSGFQTMFGFPSHSFIAPNYVWTDKVESILWNSGVKYIQSGRIQWYPSSDRNQRLRRRRFLGESNVLGQRYLVRNIDFEPASNPTLDWQDHVLAQVQLAFRLQKPAIISTHRVNFMGGLDAANRTRGLRDLQGILQGVVKQWPEVEFISTTELGEIICP